VDADGEGRPSPLGTFVSGNLDDQRSRAESETRWLSSEWERRVHDDILAALADGEEQLIDEELLNSILWRGSITR
jgi:hypothetical protein